MSGSNIAGGLLFKSADPTSKDIRFDQLPIETMVQIAENLTGPNAQAGCAGYFNHFYRWEGPTLKAATVPIGGWRLDATDGAGTASANVRAADQFGILRMLTGTNANDTATLSLIGSAFKYIVGKRLWLAARLSVVTTVAKTGIFFGLATAATADPVTTPGADQIGLTKTLTGTTFSLACIAAAAGTTTKSAVTGTIVAGTKTELMIVVDVLGNIHFYQDGTENTSALIAVADANIPAVNLTPHIEAKAQDGNAQGLDIDWLLCMQER